MQYDTIVYVLWVITTLLRIAVLVFLFQRRWYRQVPMFTSYLLIAALKGLAWWWVAHAWGVSTPFAFYFYWSTELILIFFRWAVLAEICRHTLKAYEGIWAFSRVYLVGVACALVVYAALASAAAGDWIGPRINRGKQGLEMVTLVTLVILLGVCRYYRIPFEGISKSLAMGFGLYSAAQVVSNGLPVALIPKYFNTFQTAQAVSYQVALVLWGLAIWKPVTLRRAAPATVPQGTYEAVSAGVNLRLQRLNDRLLEFLRT